MTLKEAGRRLGVTPDTLRQAIARGTLRATKVGTTWSVRPRDVWRYLATVVAPRLDRDVELRRCCAHERMAHSAFDWACVVDGCHGARLDASTPGRFGPWAKEAKP